MDVMTPPHPSTDRLRTLVVRRVIGAFAALALAGGLAAGPALTAAASTSRANSVRTTAVDASDLLAVLDDDEIAALRDGIPHVPGTGLRLGDLTREQQLAAFALLRSLLSTAAWDELTVLRDADAAAGLDVEYRLALFGEAEGDYVLQLSTGDVILSILRQGDEIDVAPDLV